MKIFQVFMFTLLLGAVGVLASSCNDDDDKKHVGTGTVTGTVTDMDGNALDGVSISVQDVYGNEEATGTTGADGKYTITNVPMESRLLTFTKEQYQKTGITIVASDYVDGVATRDVTMNTAIAVVRGRVLDARNNDRPFADVTVTLNTLETTTGSDGTYIFEELSVDDYTISFSKENYPTITLEISETDFVNDEYVVEDIKLGSEELLPGLTIRELQEADKWYYNEYRGGNAGPAPHYDWSTCYLPSMQFYGRWEAQNEGTAIRIQNGNVTSEDQFDSYLYGSKLITNDNKILSVRMRTHNDDPTFFGVQVVDLSEPEPKAVKIGNNRSHSGGSYIDEEFDLSEYIGKEVIIAIGIYSATSGNDTQFVIQAVRFADQKVEGTGWLPGTEVISGWQMTQEMIRSTMPHTKKVFDGISPIRESGDLKQSYQSWRSVDHVGHEWAFMPVQKDAEPFAGEGFVMKTIGGGATVNTVVPHAYYYAKFSIAAGSNQLQLRGRTFSGNNTFIKFTVFREDGTYDHVQPTSSVGSSAPDGCWKFTHQSGGPDNFDDYALFNVDLSPYNGEDVVVAIGVFKGENNSDESKLCIRQIEIK